MFLLFPACHIQFGKKFVLPALAFHFVLPAIIKINILVNSFSISGTAKSLLLRDQGIFAHKQRLDGQHCVHRSTVVLKKLAVFLTKFQLFLLHGFSQTP
jgi:hypothetical protein